MHALSIFPLLLSSLALSVFAQDYTSDHNITSLSGTWSSGSQRVLTGSGFANPANESFTYPLTTGISFSFTDDGFYEIARYRFNSNGSQPTCITGVLNWVHGNYQLLDNGSIICTPFGDGYQQIQDPCAAQSNFVENYNDTELYQSWNIYQDTTLGVLLQMYEFDGSPLAPMGQVSAQPNMLPTQMLRNVTPAFTTQDGFVSTGNKLAVSTANGASRQWSNMIGASTVVSILLGSSMFALVAL